MRENLNSEGTVDSTIQRLIRLVIGRSRESKHALTSHLGIMFRGHEELEELRIADRTSDIVAKEKFDKKGLELTRSE